MQTNTYTDIGLCCYLYRQEETIRGMYSLCSSFNLDCEGDRVIFDVCRRRKLLCSNLQVAATQLNAPMQRNQQVEVISEYQF